MLPCIDPSVRIVTKSPKVGPLLIFSISLSYPFNCGVDGHVDIAGETAGGPTEVGSRGGSGGHIVVARIDLGPKNNLTISRN